MNASFLKIFQRKGRRKMSNLDGLKISLCQMNVTPGRPDINSRYIIEEIHSAADRDVDIIIFPELCVTGYIIGDMFEDDYFIEDTLNFNRKIIEATKNGVAAAFGSVTVSAGKKGEDGRQRKHNTVIVAQNGEILGQISKTLQLYSTRKTAEEQSELFRLSGGRDGAREINVRDILRPVPIQARVGMIQVGFMKCEDMWHQDYVFNPSKILTEAGAELLINLSASPWTWQKNRKRHQVVKDLLRECNAPFVYVNNTGIQNNGKNIIIFDGSSAVYNADGDIIFEIPPYKEALGDIRFTGNMPPIKIKFQDDTAELFNALECGIKGFFEMLPLSMRKIAVGLSGGIDSALSLALFAKILGPENAYAIHMPFPPYSSSKHQSLACQIAQNLGTHYETWPIKEIVESIVKITGSLPDTLTYENIQARARMEILAARAQDIGCIFSSNFNKVEAAFGYGTQYADLAGYIAPLGDLVKREVYQLADYVNRVIYGREVIPKECFSIAPSAGLKENQKDPFDYGNLDRRGYHDEMVRAFTEFRKNPEWFLEKYAEGKLESEFMLESGKLSRLFPTPRDFIQDLEKQWTQFFNSYRKRVQTCSVLVVSKRAFGMDLQESLLSPHFTRRYQDLKKMILPRRPNADKTKKQIVIYGGSFNPPAKHHRKIAEELSKNFDLVIVVPCGLRPDKPSVDIISSKHRGKMAEMTFKNMPKVQIDLFDLKNDVFIPTYLLQERYENIFPDAQIWHAVGSDLVIGGGAGKSGIHNWQNGNAMWRNFNFSVHIRPGYEINAEDMPPHSELIEIKNLYGSGTMIRKRIAKGEPIDKLVAPEILDYIKKHKLYFL